MIPEFLDLLGNSEDVATVSANAVGQSQHYNSVTAL